MNDDSIALRLSAQRALWGHVPACLRAASIEKQGESLDSVARELGVRPLTEFTSMDADALAEVLGDDAEGIEVPPMQQFSAQEGLATIRALLPRPEAQSALQDLRDCERILSAAAQHGVGWHFQIDV